MGFPCQGPGKSQFVCCGCISIADIVSGFQNGKAVKEPELNKLSYADAGVYSCEVSMTGLTRRQSFELVVEGGCVLFWLCPSPRLAVIINILLLYLTAQSSLLQRSYNTWIIKKETL